MPITVFLGSFIRIAVTAAFGGFVAKGWLTTDDLEKLITYVIGIGGVLGMAGWSVIRNQLTSLLKRIEQDPTVVKVEVTDPEVVANTGPKVVEADADNDLTF